MVSSLDTGELPFDAQYGVDGSDAMSLRSGRTIRSMSKYPKDDRTRVPYSLQRHGSPNVPWAWVDIEDEVDPQQLETGLPPIPPLCSHRPLECNNCWKGYPQSRFPNWTRRQVVKSKIWNAIKDYNRDNKCVLHRIDVDTNGRFLNPGKIEAGHGQDKEAEIWKKLVDDERPEGLRVRALFLENISGPVLQMLGAKYNIEPLFWSSSLNWIPSRFQEEVKPGIGDHITITLTFLRSMSNHLAIQMSAAFATKSTDSLPLKGGGGTEGKPSTMLGSQQIDPHSPLVLHSNDRLLVLDLLAVHLIRNVNGSTIISFHPTLNLLTTTAAFLQERIRFAGQSVYWQSIFQKSADPTFLLLAFVWHALYSWDEAIVDLYEHIFSLEFRVLDGTLHAHVTRELYFLRAHNVHYLSLLEDISLHVSFIRDTVNPALDGLPSGERILNKGIMQRETEHLLTHITKLGAELNRLEERIRNIKELTESQFVQRMSEATLRDSEAMKRVAYLTIFFLPASFIASIFGMNVAEINPGSFGSLWQFFVTALLLTWIIIAFQSNYIFQNDATSFTQRIAWPVYLAIKCAKYVRRGIFRTWRLHRKDEEMGWNI